MCSVKNELDVNEKLSHNWINTGSKFCADGNNKKRFLKPLGLDLNAFFVRAHF